jgi:two-component system sensor histidine kinase RegB
MFGRSLRANWVRLRTLIVLRWIAIAGQIAAITVAQRLFDLELELGWVFLAIGASVTVNLIAIFIYPENKRLSESEVALHLIFDISQLSALLYLSGGLNNPFALLILIPVTVSATALKSRTTVIVGTLSILMVAFLSVFHIPLRTGEDVFLSLPQIFVQGFLVAIVVGVIFLAAFAQRVTSEVNAMQDALTATQWALSREQKLTDLGGVVAAAAHELGTPLATIKLVSSELREELEGQPDLRDDAALIGEQADRCRDILRSMGRAGKDDLHLKQGPVGAVVREAAEPHEGRGVHVNYDIAPDGETDPRQPAIYRRPEIIHGLRNLVQNAVDFAEENIWVDVRWSDDRIRVRIVDDGSGFPTSVLGRIGDPFVRSRREKAPEPSRPEYEGMGLGLFIAKTLLERSGAELAFSNGSDPYGSKDADVMSLGAIVEVQWRRSDVEIETDAQSAPLGANPPITA